MCFQSLEFVLIGDTSTSTICSDNDFLHFMGFVNPQGWSPWTITWNNQPEVLWPNATFTFESGQWYRENEYVRKLGRVDADHLRVNR